MRLNNLTVIVANHQRELHKILDDLVAFFTQTCKKLRRKLALFVIAGKTFFMAPINLGPYSHVLTDSKKVRGCKRKAKIVFALPFTKIPCLSNWFVFFFTEVGEFITGQPQR